MSTGKVNKTLVFFMYPGAASGRPHQNSSKKFIIAK